MTAVTVPSTADVAVTKVDNEGNESVVVLQTQVADGEVSGVTVEAPPVLAWTVVKDMGGTTVAVAL